MPRGGARPNSGRKKGKPLKSTEKQRQNTADTIRAARENGKELPLDYMLKVMRDPAADEKRKDDMAKAAAPFIHARLAATEVTHRNAIDDMDEAELMNELERIERRLGIAEGAAHAASTPGSDSAPTLN